MAAPVVESVSTSTSTASTNPNAVFTKPSGTASGDMLLVLISLGRERTLPVSAPDGTWTVIYSQTLQRSGIGTEFGGIYAAWKTAGGSEPASYTFGFADTSIHVGGMLRISGADTSSIVSAINSAAAATGGSRDAPTVNAPAADSLLVTFIADGISNGGPFTTPGGTTEQFDLRSNTTSTSSVTASGVAGSETVASGATGTRTYTANDTSFSRSYSGVSVAIGPTGGGGGAQSLTPSLYSSSQAFYAPTVAPGAVSLVPSLHSGAQTFHAPTVGATYSLSPSLITDGETFHAPAVTAGAVTLTPSLLSGGEQFFAPTVGTSITLAADLVTNAATFHAPTVAPGTVTLSPSLVDGGNTFHDPAVTSGTVLQPGLADNGQTFYGPSVAVGTVTLAASLFTASQTFFAPTVGDNDNEPVPLNFVVQARRRGVR